MVDGALKVMLDAIDLHKDLIEMPLPLSMLAHVGGAFRSDLAGEDRTRPVDPKTNAFLANVDPALMQKVFDIAK